MAQRAARARSRARLLRGPASAPRTVAMLVFPGFQLLDAVGPLDVFAGASEAWRERHPEDPLPYATELVAPQAGPPPGRGRDSAVMIAMPARARPAPSTKRTVMGSSRNTTPATALTTGMSRVNGDSAFTG